MKKFSDIIGQKAIIEHLYNALRTGSISHAYILSGDAGSGRKTIASIFAAAMQCEDLQVEELVPEDAPGGAVAGEAPAAQAAIAVAEAPAASAAPTAQAAPAAQDAPAAPADTRRTWSGVARTLEPCGSPTPTRTKSTSSPTPRN